MVGYLIILLCFYTKGHYSINICINQLMILLSEADILRCNLARVNGVQI